MVEKISKLIESELKSNKSFEEIKSKLLSEGYLERDVNEAAKLLLQKHSKDKEGGNQEGMLTRKMFLDRISYGFGANQFINILFSMTSASYFFIGFINAIRSSLSTLLSGFLNEYSGQRNLSRKFIRTSGLLFGFSFLFLALSVSIRSKVLFAISLLLGSIGVVSYGDSFRNRMIRKMGKMNFSIIISKYSFIGLLITVVSLVLSGYIMQLIPVGGSFFIIQALGFKLPFRLYGYLIAFMITAIASIFSAHVLAKMRVDGEDEQLLSFGEFLQYYSEKIKKNLARFFKNKYLFTITLATLFIAVFQSVLNSFVGIHIYFTYIDVWFKGFMNVAVIFGVALLASYLGPVLASKLNKYLGLAPMFVFGAIVMTFLPLTIVFNPTSYFPAVLVAASISVIGVSIIGTGQSLLASKLLNEKDRNIYYASAGVVTVLPFLILVTFLVSLVHVYGLIALFKIISVGAIVTLIPIYLVIVFWSTKKRI